MRTGESQLDLGCFLEQTRTRRTILTTLLHIGSAKATMWLLDDSGLGDLKDACCQGLETYEKEMFALLHRGVADVLGSTTGQDIWCQQSIEDTSLEGWMWMGQFLDLYGAFLAGYRLLRTIVRDALSDLTLDLE